ncbi:MAG TPA: DUF192 domain-containing protein [Thermoanaerobaculia bacterium]|nr:DUF192 domain-containing protein [Thermoanaerobaculia bacterium]
MRYALLLILTLSCAQPSTPPPATSEPASTSAPAAAAAGPRVIFPDGFVVSVEVVADDESRAQGLMWRDQLRPGTGMLFVFPADDVFSFWMKNTLIPLDMIWIDSSQRVAGVIFNVPPCKVENCPSYSPNVTARYILEVAGGVAEAHGLKVGDQLRFEALPNIQVR